MEICGSRGGNPGAAMVGKKQHKRGRRHGNFVKVWKLCHRIFRRAPRLRYVSAKNVPVRPIGQVFEMNPTVFGTTLLSAARDYQRH
jgi:hypothetical protein